MSEFVNSRYRSGLGAVSPAFIVGLYCLLVVALFFGTVSTMVNIWISSESYQHSFLIVPISIWLVWRQREELRGNAMHPEPRILLLTACGTVIWFIGRIVDVNVVEQLAFVGITITGVWSILGTPIARKVIFPLCFLFLAVPMGSALIPPLMDMTARSTEFLVRASSVPVYREGMYLSLPSGQWSVVQACSGIRYLIASFTLGLVYAWLTYRSYWRRTAFVVASIIVPIIANSIRAYGIVMLGHISNMKLATGVDHLIYGWVFFGAVMILVFWVGNFWAEPETRQYSEEYHPAPADKAQSSGWVRCLVCFSAAVIISGSGPALVWAMDHPSNTPLVAALEAPSALFGWEASIDPNWNWQPNQMKADRSLDRFYFRPGQATVGLFIRQYTRQQPGVELVHYAQPWLADRKSWRLTAQQSRKIDLGEVEQIDEVEVGSAHVQLLLWSWYRVDGQNTSNPYLAKLLEAKQRILHGYRKGSRIYVATPVGDDREAARKRLQSFLDAHLGEVERELNVGLSDLDRGQ